MAPLQVFYDRHGRNQMIGNKETLISGGVLRLDLLYRITGHDVFSHVRRRLANLRRGLCRGPRRSATDRAAFERDSVRPGKVVAALPELHSSWLCRPCIAL